MKRISSFLSALIFLLAGCGEERDIVARVGEVEISKVDFTTFVAQLAPGLRSSSGPRPVLQRWPERLSPDPAQMRRQM